MLSAANVAVLQRHTLFPAPEEGVHPGEQTRTKGLPVLIEAMKPGGRCWSENHTQPRRNLSERVTTKPMDEVASSAPILCLSKKESQPYRETDWLREQVAKLEFWEGCPTLPGLNRRLLTSGNICSTGGEELARANQCDWSLFLMTHLGTNWYSPNA